MNTIICLYLLLFYIIIHGYFFMEVIDFFFIILFILEFICCWISAYIIDMYARYRLRLTIRLDFYERSIASDVCVRDVEGHIRRHSESRHSYSLDQNRNGAKAEPKPSQNRTKTELKPSQNRAKTDRNMTLLDESIHQDTFASAFSMKNSALSRNRLNQYIHIMDG